MIEQKNKKLSPVIVLIILIFSTVLLSGILSFIGLQAEYSTVNSVSGKLINNVIQVNNLLSTHGIKNIIVTTTNYFVSFLPFSMLLIILLGIGVMEKSGFIKTAFTMLTKNSKRYTITFFLVLISLICSIFGGISYVILIPLGALLFKYGKRNPLGGIIVTFASLSIGSSINVLISATDSSLMNMTLNATKVIDKSYIISPFFNIYIMIFALIIFAFAFTYITEKIVMPRLKKIEILDDEEQIISKRQLRGIIMASTAGILYILIIIYMIIPGLPFSGILLDESAKLYVDQVLGPNSLFNQGLVFIVTILFSIVGIVYGIFAKTTRTMKEITDGFGFSLDNVGNIIVIIFFSSILINAFELSNIGNVLTALLTTFIGSFNTTGLLLIILLFIVSAISILFNTNFISGYAIMSGTVVPTFINASISPQFTQLIYTVGSSITLPLTPLFVFFSLYVAFLDKYESEENLLKKAYINIIPYIIVALIIWFIIIIVWYILGLPIGINTLPGVSYVS